MGFLAKDILTASKRSFGFKSGEVIPGTAFHWERELGNRDCSARWAVSTPGGPHLYICELIDPAEDPLLLALTSNCQAANGLTRHSGLANVLAAGWLKDGVYFQVLDLFWDEQPLAIYKPAKVMAEDHFLLTAERLIEALIHLHKNNLLHAAISPECLRVDEDGLRIADFWWSRACLGNAFDDSIETYYPHSLSNMSLLCLAPELLLLGSKAPLKESDLYSLGCTLFYLLTGQLPRQLDYTRDSGLTIQEVASAPLKNLFELRPGLKPQIYRAIDFCLQDDDLGRENIFLVRDLIKEACGRYAAKEED